MENFDWTKFSRKIAIKAPMKTIYDAWTISSELEKWFLNTATYFDKEGNVVDNLSNVLAEANYEWTWYLYDDIGKGRVIEANGKDNFQFTFAGECSVDIHLSEVDGYTIVDLTQKNIPTDNESKRGIRLGCHTGWSFFLLNLKSYYEFGNDLRNKNSEFIGMMNN
jgi:hypothetical protein